MREINVQDNIAQEKDVEIERLRTTCDQLAARVSITEDVQNQNEVLKRRLASTEELNNQQHAQINSLHQEVRGLRSELTESMTIRTDLQRKLERSTAYVLEMEEKVYKSNRISLEILKELKDSEVEIGALQQYIVDLKQRIAVYIPVKEDQVDRKLAEYINNYPERNKLKIMFMRESSGVYQFGQRRVQVKVERDNIKIRVGGGYLSIDQFLEQYTPQELERLERKDPLKRLSEKITVQSTIANHAAKEDQPLRCFKFCCQMLL